MSLYGTRDASMNWQGEVAKATIKAVKCRWRLVGHERR